MIIVAIDVCVICIVVFLCLVYIVFGSIFLCLQAEDGIRDLVRSRGLGDVYKRQFSPNLSRMNSAAVRLPVARQRGDRNKPVTKAPRLSLIHI